MPEISDDEHSGNITPRRPTKADHVTARRFRSGLPPACLLWARGYRQKMTPQQWRSALSTRNPKIPE